MSRTFFTLALFLVLLPLLLWALVSEPDEEARTRDLLHPL